jgi:hypothetical protein
MAPNLEVQMDERRQLVGNAGAVFPIKVENRISKRGGQQKSCDRFEGTDNRLDIRQMAMNGHRT